MSEVCFSVSCGVTLPPSGHKVLYMCCCSSSTATRRKRSAPSTLWMIIQPSRCPGPPLAPEPEETLLTETGSSSRTWCLCTSPLPLLLLPPLPPLHSPSLAKKELQRQQQQLQDFPPRCPPHHPPLPPHPLPSSRSWTFRWTMARTTFPRWTNSTSSNSRSKRRRRRRKSTTPSQDWMVSEYFYTVVLLRSGHFKLQTAGVKKLWHVVEIKVEVSQNGKLSSSKDQNQYF